MSQAVLNVELTCDGCGKPIDAFKSHIHLVSKVVRFDIVRPPVEGRTDDAEYEDDNATAPVLGTRSGVAWEMNLHDNKCLVAYFDQKKVREATPRIKFNTDSEEGQYVQTDDELAEGSDK